LDFFRFRKSQSIMELIHMNSNKDIEKELVLATATIGEENLKLLQREETGHGAAPVVKGLPLPHVPGQKRHLRMLRGPHIEPTPSWIEDRNKINMDPVKGMDLGSAVPPIPKELLPQPEVAKLIVTFKRGGPLPVPTHSRATCGIEGRPAGVVTTRSVPGINPVWDEIHDINGYIADESKSLEFNIWDSTLLVKLLLPQAKFYPNGFEGALSWSGGKIEVKIQVTLPTTIIDARRMLLSTFGEEARQARKNAELKAIMAKLRHIREEKEAINRVQELEFIRNSRVTETRRTNIVEILQSSCPCELFDRGPLAAIGRPQTL